MDYIIENEYLKVTVATSGAQIKSVIRKCDGAEHIWQADPEVWGNSAPILFPHCGRLLDGKFIAKGKTYETNLAHGFARLMEHTFVYQNKDTLVLQLTDTPETLALWPCSDTQRYAPSFWQSHDQDSFRKFCPWR